MKRHVDKHFGFLKTTLIGGLVFLLPIAVVGWLLAQVGQIVWHAFSAVQEFLKEHEGDAIGSYAELSSGEYLMLFALSLGLMLSVCFLAGLIARRSLGKWFSERAERYLSMLFPRYAVFKDQLAGNLGKGTLKPVIAQVGPWTRIGVEVERDRSHGVTVYLPSSPDPWTGTVTVVPPEAVTPIEGDFGDVMATFEQLGRGTSRYLRPMRSSDPPSDPR